MSAKPGPFSWKNLRMLMRGRVPGQLIVQFSDRCNARCPQCEMRVQNKYERTTLHVSSVKRAIDAAAERGVEAVSLTGGEPFLYKDQVLELIRHAASVGIPYLRTGTNGFMFCGSEKPNFRDKVKVFAEELAETELYTFWISLDSVETEVHEDMRGLPGVVRGIEIALPILESYGIYPSANLGINRNAGGNYHELLPDVPEDEYDPERVYDYFRSAFDRFYRKAADLGFSIINMCYPMSVDPALGDGLSSVYSATASDRIVRFRPDEKKPLFEALLHTVPEHRSRIRIFTPLVSVKALIEQYAHGIKSRHGCRGGVDFHFIDSRTGHAYPCGYRGDEDLGLYWEMDSAELKPVADCTDCDWECFRDPSELIGPLLDGFRQPFRTLSWFWKNRAWTRTWLQDLKYYRACDYFCGRKPADQHKLAKFALGESAKRETVSQDIPMEAISNSS